MAEFLAYQPLDMRTMFEVTTTGPLSTFEGVGDLTTLNWETAGSSSQVDVWGLNLLTDEVGNFIDGWVDRLLVTWNSATAWQYWAGFAEEPSANGTLQPLLDGTLDVSVLFGSSDSITGSSGADWLSGYGESDSIQGAGGSDTLSGESGDDTLIGDAGNDSMVGGTDNDSLVGGAGDDSMVGGTGNDSMLGGTGRDTYVVDSISDQVNETSAAAFEIDTVRASVSWSLGANLENLELTGSGVINGTGNALANTITGNALRNTLDGGGGNDTLVGGGGNDNYIVDSLVDHVVESSTVATESDSVFATVNWTLGANLENLRLWGTDDLQGTGNGAANRILGNTGANRLVGANGNDTLTGDAGNDTLLGGLGNDSLVGGAGLDVLRFHTALSAATNVDRISGFVTADDTIQLENGIFTALTAAGALPASAFRAGTGAGDSNDRIIYNSTTSQLFYDADGTGAGAQILFATFAAGTVLTASDFVII